MAPDKRKSTQRSRLIAGMVAATNRRGYAGASVSAVIAEAGVSRPTFYDYFADREACFAAALAEIQAQAAEAVQAALARTDRGEGALQRAVRALVELGAGEPERARFLMAESMSGGSRALEERDRGLAQLAALISARREPGSARRPDIDPRVVLGSAYRMIAARLRRGEPASGQLADELAWWIGGYDRPARERQWSKLRAGRAPAASPHVPTEPIHQMPGVLPPGRPWLPPEEIRENHRRRILFAAATLAEEKGAAGTTVTEITRRARVDGRAFYRLFADKQEALGAVHELGFQQVMDVTTNAYFSVEGWPERSWEAGRALTQLLQRNALVARIGFVEAYAIGPGAIQRVEDSHTAFLFFLQEGLLLEGGPPGPSRVAMEAIIAAVFEIIYLGARKPGEPKIAGLLPHIAHVWLTPFLGAHASDEFIDSHMAGSRPARRAHAPRAR